MILVCIAVLTEVLISLKIYDFKCILQYNYGDGTFTHASYSL